MPSGLRGGVVIVVPAFAEGEHRDPETVRRGVAGAEPLRSPHVSRGIHEPSGVEADDRSEEDSPKHTWPSPDREKRHADYRQRNPMPLADPDVESVFAEFGDVGE